MLRPKLLTTLQGYTRSQLTADLTAGVIVGIVALPLSIAFAIASGVTPDRGLWTAIVAGFLISALGGSRVQIGGPTGAFVVIVYGIVQQHGVDGLIVATLMAGLILITMGALRLGSTIKFIPHPVIVGFTSGIALIIFSSQVKDFFGLSMGEVPAEFVLKWKAFALNAGTVNLDALFVAGVALALLLFFPRVNRRIPAPFVALIVTAVMVPLLGLEVETIGSRFGSVATGLPRPVLPDVGFTQMMSLVGPALTIAMLGGIESLLSAVVADGMIGGRHRSDMELIGQGVASAMVGGIPATGALARTATNVKAGGRTPIAGMVHAVTLLLIALFFGKWAAAIPLAALAAILVVVAYNMSEWRVFAAELRGARADVAVLLATFALTVLVDLTVAIGVGMVLASFLFMRRMAEVSGVQVLALSEEEEEGAEPVSAEPRVPKDVQVYAINGPFFFGAADRFKDTLREVSGRPAVLILRLGGVPVIDSTGIHVLRDVVRRSRREGTRVMLTEVRPEVEALLARSGLGELLGEGGIQSDLSSALGRVRDGTKGPGSPPGAERRRSRPSRGSP